MTELKRCPFCGREARIEHKERLETWIVECSNGMCPASYMIGMDYDTKQEAIEVWNTRYTADRKTEQTEREGE